MSLSSEMGAVFSSLAKEFGRSTLKLSVFTPATGPAHNPGKPSYNDVPFGGFARGVSAYHLTDTMIQSSDQVVQVPGTITPKMQDLIIISGTAYTIVKIDPKYVNDSVVAYEVIVRK